MDLVRVRTPGRHEKLGSRPPGTLTMGKIATVEIAGLINGAASAEGDSMAPAYYIRIDNLPAILIYEEWLEEAWAPLSPQIIYSSRLFRRRGLLPTVVAIKDTQ